MGAAAVEAAIVVSVPAPRAGNAAGVRAAPAVSGARVAAAEAVAVAVDAAGGVTRDATAVLLDAPSPRMSP